MSVVNAPTDGDGPVSQNAPDDVEAASADDLVSGETFERWLMSSQCALSEVVLQWWRDLRPPGEGEAADVKVHEHETAVDLWRHIADDVREAAKNATTDEVTACTARLHMASAAVGGRVTVRSLLAWCRHRIGEDFGRAHEESDEEIEDILRFELCSVDQFFASQGWSGTMENGEEVLDPEVEATRVAESIVYGWPSVSSDPVRACDVGRFPRAHPLDFPMGIVDLHDPRTHKVSPQDWAQHLLRYHTGHFVHGLRGHRVVWAIVNAVLLSEARGKGYAVQRNVLRRIGCRMVGHHHMSRGELRDLMGQKDGVRSIVHQLMSVGRDVRATPMHFAHKRKELDCAVKHLSWRPPWVRRGVGVVGDDSSHAFIAANTEVEDSIGLGRIPSQWFTLNCPYNSVYEIHRLNVEAEGANEALTSRDAVSRQVRYDFIRDSPDVAAMMMSLRAELTAKIVMPTCVTHSDNTPFLTMMRTG